MVRCDCDRRFCTSSRSPVEAKWLRSAFGADVVATNPDGFLVVSPGRHCADGNGVGSQDLRRFGGACFAVHEAAAALQRACIANVHGVTAHWSWGVRSRTRPPVRRCLAT